MLFESLGFNKGKQGDKPLFGTPEEYLRIKKWDAEKMDRAQAIFDAMPADERARYVGIGADPDTKSALSWHAPKEDTGGLEEMLDAFSRAKK
jgi:hypothetical protein